VERPVVPPLSLRDLEGAWRPLAAAWAAGPALLCIGHSDCQTSRLTLAHVDRLHRRRTAPVEVVAIVQDAPATARDLAAALGLELPVLIEDDPYPVSEALGLTTVPTLLLVDAGGRVAERSEGFHRAALESLAERLGVPPPFFAPEDTAPALRPG
jgi:hypothetical protein